jgi:integrase
VKYATWHNWASSLPLFLFLCCYETLEFSDSLDYSLFSIGDKVMELGRSAERFLEAAARKSLNSARTYRNALNRFSLFYQNEGTLEDFMRRVREDNKLEFDDEKKKRIAEETLSKYIAFLHGEKLSRKAIRLYCSAIQGLFKYHGVPISLAWTGLPANKAEVEMYSWKTANRVEEFVNCFESLQYKTLAVLAFQSGLSISDLLGLRYGSIRTEYEKRVAPLALSFTIQGREKTQVSFRTYVGRWTLKLLDDYLKEKNVLGDDMRLFPISPESVDSAFRTAARKFLGATWTKGRNPCSPSSLRHGFKTLAVKSEVLEPIETEYLMGHELGDRVEAIYLTRDVDDWREVYAKLEPFLTPNSLKIV